MKRLIKNYTTEVPADQTIAEIQTMLAHNGARGIALEYDAAGRIKDIFIKITLREKELPFRRHLDVCDAVRLVFVLLGHLIGDDAG